MMVYQTAFVLEQGYIKLINGTGPCSSHGMMAEIPPALTFSESREIVSENLGSLACWNVVEIHAEHFGGEAPRSCQSWWLSD